MFLSVNINTTGDTSGAGSVYSSELSRVQPDLSGILVVQSIVYCVGFCRSLFVLFLLPIVLSDLRLTASNYPFVLFNFSCHCVFVMTCSIFIDVFCFHL